MYELVKWNGQLTTNVSMGCESILLNKEILNLATFDDDGINCNVVDVDFKTSVSKADRNDYLFSIFSGIFSEAIDQLLINNKIKNYKTQNSLKDDKKGELFELASIALRTFETKKGNKPDYDKRFNDFFNSVNKNIKNAPEYKKLAKDFSNDLSYRALLMSIIESVFDCKMGLDENGEFTILPADDCGIKGLNLIGKIEAGALSWIINEVEKYKETGKFEEQVDELIKAKGGIKKVEKIIKELAESSLFKDGQFDKSKTYNYLVSMMNEFNTNEDATPDALIVNEIPVFINACLTRTYYFIKCLLEEVNKHHVHTIEGLKIIELGDVLNKNKSVLRRMDTVSTGMLALFNVGIATAVGIKKGLTVAAVDIANENYLDAILKGLPAAASEIAIRININGCVAFTTAWQIDKEYIIEDIKKFFNSKEEVVLNYSEKNCRITDEEIAKLVGLNKVETRILYSLELQLVKDDIKNTKESDEQLSKKEWLDKWKIKTIESINLNKVFEEDEEKLYKQIKTHASVNDKIWLYKIILEIISFRPYCKLDEKDKKKKLKLVNKTYLKRIFCNEQNILDYKEVEQVTNEYKKNKEALSLSTIKKVAIASVSVFGLAGAAFVFAPMIAVALVGGSLSLSGAALTSASLAIIGGGSIAAGGLGMAGGTIIIAGGGALLGFGASGASITAFTLMSNPNYVLEDYAKLLTKCQIMMLKKFGMNKEVHQILEQIKDTYSSYSIQIKVLDSEKNKSDECKELISDLKKSTKIMERSIKVLNKRLNNAAN